MLGDVGQRALVPLHGPETVAVRDVHLGIRNPRRCEERTIKSLDRQALAIIARAEERQVAGCLGSTSLFLGRFRFLNQEQFLRRQVQPDQRRTRIFRILSWWCGGTTVILVPAAPEDPDRQ